MPTVPLEQAIRDRAAEQPDRPAVTVGASTATRAEFDELVDRGAWRLREMGAQPGSVVGLCGPNSVALVAALFAVWRCGAVPMPLHGRKSANELADALNRADAVVAIGYAPEVDVPHARVTTEELMAPGPVGRFPAAPVSPSQRIAASGGSTGPSKLIIVAAPAQVNPDRPFHKGMARDGTHVVPLHLMDGIGFFAITTAVALGNHVVLEPGASFDPVAFLAQVQARRADWSMLTQPYLVAVAKLPGEVRSSFDVSSLRSVVHSGGGVVEWVNRVWIDWLGPHRVWQLYGASDSRGSAWIDGDEWLAHPGSVGHAQAGCEITVFDDAGNPVPPGTTGLVYLRDLTGRVRRKIVGQDEVPPGEWETVGDLGWMDEDGYLYFVDRAKDMISTAEGPVAPLNVEGALEAHPGVRSAVVIGLPDGLGHERVHALIDVPGEPVPTGDELQQFLREAFPDVRVPDTFEYCPGPLRDEAGKSLRNRLRADRLASGGPH